MIQHKNSRYKILRTAPMNRAQRRAAKRGKDYIYEGSGKREKGKTLLKPYSESGLDFGEQKGNG